MLPMLRPLSLSPLGLLAVLALAACGGEARPEPPRGVVLVTIDTLRADRLGPYRTAEGVAAPTPNADRLAAEGVVFDNAAAPMPVTRPSHFSMFTGRYPREHGVVDNRWSLPDSETTLAEAFAAAGWRTGGFSGVALFGRPSGAAQGFDTYEVPVGKIEERGERVVTRAVEWLRSLGAEERFFLWVHLYDPHMPYAPPPLFQPAAGESMLSEATWGGLSRLAREHGGNLGRRFERSAHALYRGEVAYVDAALGALLAELDARGLADDTAVVWTADHGECFENGYFFRHANCLYEGAVRVPLIVRFPGRVPAGERVARQVELLDLAPTLAGWAGLELPGVTAGRPLFPGPGGDEDGGEGEERYALVEHPMSPTGAVRNRQRLWDDVRWVVGEPMRPIVRVPQAALRGRRWKYIATGADGEELYDLAADPAETTNVAAEHPEVARELRRELRRRLGEHPLVVLPGEEIDPELRRQLETLGYL